ncbi:LDH2 family malate/lactate/ureidoglycolate dehydrogenase [Homoserinimonas aerilata]|uniref:LDH2 family malate/lactate/ureidoglycolate dehydrogenase n=1 Tax=Homoserinimonas aerilata TaxID=1162970 RepID=A0A542YAA1_9MICO|nr:Ldh family oxidoreductase [Homoserinimonas aerilata]TQL45029.1 LDH2 family malate/lactate/ureidoglycolate dehydrogenase [Homoserinimonas aerilata]
MTPEYLFIPHTAVAEQIRVVLTAWGMLPDDVEKTVDAMVDTDLRGIDSHGISMLMTYDRLRASGRLAIDAPRTITAETPAVATIDAGGGLGHPAAVDAMRLAMDKARTVGIGAVAVRNSHHFGALGSYARLAAAEGMMAFVTTSTRLTGVLPTGSRQSRLGTNPLAFAAPGRDGEPLVLDMSTSVVASNKVRSYALKQLPVPDGWVIDGDGESITDAAAAYEAIQHDENAGLTPLGGPDVQGGGHKGYGLSLMVQILSCALAGAGMPGTGDIGHFFLALRPDAFSPAGTSADYVDELLRSMRGSEPLNPTFPVLVPGDPEAAERERRLRDGVPLPSTLLAQLRELCTRNSAPYVLELTA